MKFCPEKSRRLPVRLKNRDIALAGLMTALTACGAFVKIPLPYVPLTLQTLFVYLSGALLGARLGALSQAAYVILGLMGLPIFAGGGGPAYVLHPTFGYLIGFIVAAYLIGRIVEQRPRPGYTRTLGAMSLGLCTVYLFGTTILYLNVRLLSGAQLSFRHIFKLGCLLPLPGDALKILAAAYLATRMSEKKAQKSSTLQNFY